MNKQEVIDREGVLPDPTHSLSEKTREKLNRLNQKISELDQLRKEYGDRGVLDAALEEITRLCRAFYSKTFFMVTFGMLKAGKSTLVNTFVGKKVSPVGRSKETTLRSSIILAADSRHKEGIYIYSPDVGNQPDSDTEQGTDDKQKRWNWKKENSKQFLDYLGDPSLENIFLGRFKVDFVPFSETALTSILTKTEKGNAETDVITDTILIPGSANEQRADALPPVIRIDPGKMGETVDAASLLQSGVAILDTPGLDGALSSAISDPFWDALPDFGDYYLLVQSSMSAINRDCLALVKKVCSRTDKVPVLVVFNKIAADFWLKQNAQEKKLEEDSVVALKELSDRLKQALHGKGLESISINAGEASDAIFRKPENDGDYSIEKTKMLEDSHIQVLRKCIVDTLRNKRSAIKEGNVTSRLLISLSAQKKTISAEKEKLETGEEERQSEFDKRRNEMKSRRERLVHAFDDEMEGGVIAKALGSQIEFVLKERFSQFGLPKNEYKKNDSDGKENRNHRNRTIEEEKLVTSIETVKDSFLGLVKGLFVGSDLDIGGGNLQAKWNALEDKRKNLCKEKDELAAIAKIDKSAADRYFPDSLVESLDVDELLNLVMEKSKGISVPDIPLVGFFDQLKQWRIRRFGSENTVFESKCYEAFDELLKSLAKIFPDNVAKLVGDAVARQISSKGTDYAKQLAKRINAAIDRERETGDRIHSEFVTKRDSLTKAEKCIDEMKSILEEV